MTKFLFVQCVDMNHDQMSVLSDHLGKLGEKEGYTFILSDKPFKSVDKEEIIKVLRDEVDW